MMILAQMDAANKALEQVASMGERSLLISAIFTLGMAVAYIAKVFQNRHDKVCARLDTVQDQHTKFLEDNTKELSRVLEHNSSALLEFSHSLSSIHRLLEGSPKAHLPPDRLP